MCDNHTPTHTNSAHARSKVRDSYPHFGTPPRLIERPAAVVTGSTAELLRRILASAHVAAILNDPPLWVDRGDLTATITAIHHAARAFTTQILAPKRNNTPTPDATMPPSDNVWTTQRAADYLGISIRRV